MDTEARFWAKVDKSGECWVWTGRLNQYGYGYFHIGKKSQLAHRLAYVFAGGTLTPNIILHHTCGHRACVNSEHLEPMTLSGHTSNHRRGQPIPYGQRVLSMSCRNGHPFTEETTYWRKDGGRRCRICQQEQHERWLRNHPNYARNWVLAHPGYMRDYYAAHT